jgi:uncharacterized protein YndB with AHSA1/START domain
MASAVASTVINQPIEKVFSYITQVENHKAWQAGIVDARVAPAGPIALGSIYTYTSEVLGRKMETSMQVSQFEANRKWAIKTTGVPTPVETVYQFEPAGSGTKLTVSMELSGGFPAMAEAAVKAQMQKSMEEQANRMKQNLEK